MESGEVELRPWRHEVVALLAAVFEERLCHHRTDLVSAGIAVEVAAVPIPQESGFGSRTTGFER